jgi:hypothetical protein
MFAGLVTRLTRIIALATLTVSVASGVAPEVTKAESGIRYENNGMSLSISDIFGRKHSQPMGVQVPTKLDNPRQLFDEINIGNDKLLIKTSFTINVSTPIKQKTDRHLTSGNVTRKIQTNIS